MKEVYVIVSHGLKNATPLVRYYNAGDNSFSANPHHASKYKDKHRALSAMINISKTKHTLYKVELFYVTGSTETL